jgi:hypothetical protein
MNLKKIRVIVFFTFVAMNYSFVLLSGQEENSDQKVAIQQQEGQIQDEINLENQEDDIQILQEDIQQQENSESGIPEIDPQLQEEQIRDEFFGILTFIELIHDAGKVAQEVDQFFYTYNVTPMTKIRDFAGVDSPRISLLRLATHAARIDGQEGKFELLDAMLKRGGNPFIIEEGERFSLAQENALCAVQLCHCDQTGYLDIYEYETASEKVKARARKRHGTLCKNAKRIQEMFEDYEPQSNFCLKA